jgi:hypothetical protein
MALNNKTKTNAEKIPLHTRFALRLIQILIILLAIVLIQRCLAIYQETKPVDQNIVQEYYQKGFEAGKNKAQGQEVNILSDFEKYSFKKSYRDGYRDGWDQERAKNKL